MTPTTPAAPDPRRREQHLRRWRRGLLAALAGAAAIAALVWAFAPQPVEVELGQATEGPFETSVEEDGKTRLRDRYVVSAPLAGQLDRIVLREGDEVRADQVVASLTPVLPPMQDERTLREQQLRVEVAEAAAQRAAARVEVVRAALQKARSEAERSEQLARQDFISPLRLEADRLAVQGAQGELDAAQQERHVAGHEIEQARAALIVASRPAAGAPRRFVLSSPIAGRVLRVVQASEGNVALGAPLLELGDTARLEVVAELLTTDALQARPGSRVVIERWGGPGLLEGRVRRVEPAAFTKVSALGVEEQRVRVLIDLASPAAQWQALGDGYRVGVRIVTLALPRVLKVPVGAVFPLPSPGVGMGVFVVAGGRAWLRQVDVGARNGGEAWIREGLPAGADVIVYPASTVRDGVRVHARKV
jgi:HlyD family secretion protein